jgi:plastocyanin
MGLDRKLATGLCVVTILLASCGNSKKADSPTTQDKPEAPRAPVVSFFKVDPATAGTISGIIRYIGVRPRPKLIDMSEDPACVEAHHTKAYDESLVVSQGGRLANAFIYVKRGLEGKHFETPQIPVTIDQRGCWFRPRVIGIQVGQQLRVVNSDPVTHNIHPLAQINREWNHSQGPGDPPLARKFIKPETMIPVKCNIHSWMHAFIGVVDNPYFAVSGDDGSFQIRNLPPGDYVIEAWQEKLGTQDQDVSVGPSSDAKANFTFRSK